MLLPQVPMSQLFLRVNKAPSATDMTSSPALSGGKESQCVQYPLGMRPWDVTQRHMQEGAAASPSNGETEAERNPSQRQQLGIKLLFLAACN